MQISKQTFEILKNFSEINSSILIKPGQKLETISEMKNILAKADVPEDFQTEFGIYDLTEFLNLIDYEIFQGGNFAFDDKYLTLENGSARSKYYYAAASNITSPTKSITMPNSEIKFELKQEDLNHIKNMAAILHKQDIAIRNIYGDIVISILEKKDASSSTFDLVLGSNNVSGNFCMYFKEEYLKIMKGSYDVEISSEAISYFRHQDLPLEYWIALEPDSYYDEAK